ncbi:hypothetical protein B0I29_108316 [Actinoplanes lutulentus]|uniref:Uncharacterized protein n=1 Tax=Actinoplanes lutulentus TaxID=1287878 RepID=A0A327ZDB8_9ACTN|nr:hypothetical protein [Actinoplanes lutulentus]RAK36726.1 hypothetical protein B0I29_108316 [Actinoplanes lutulentus]
MTSDARPTGLVTGCLVAISFGTVFILVNSGGLSSPWPLIIRLAGVIAAVALLVALFRTVRTAAAPGTVPDVRGFTDRRYWLVVAVEVIALFGGLYVINGVLELNEVSVAWVATVVGVHFFALAWAWRMPMYHWLGAVMTVLGLAGFAAWALTESAATVGLIAGVGSGVALFGMVVAALRQARG